MSVVGNLHERFLQSGKIILKGLLLTFICISVIYTTFGISGCKNVDKVSDSLIFSYNEDATLATLDPAFIKSQSEIWVAQQLYNGLIELDSALKPKPALAYRWELSPNNCVYKFFIRSDAYFHPAQGKPVIPRHAQTQGRCKYWDASMKPATTTAEAAAKVRNQRSGAVRNFHGSGGGLEEMVTDFPSPP